MESRFLKIYAYSLIIITSFYVILDLSYRLTDDAVLGFLAGIGGFGQFMLFILSIIFLFYLILNKFEKIYLALPLVQILTILGGVIFVMITSITGTYSFDLSSLQNIIEYTITRLLHVLLIIFSIYLLKRKMKIIPQKKDKNSP